MIDPIDLFAPQKIAKLVKQKGFDEPCFGFYSAMKGENNKFVWANSSIKDIIEFSHKRQDFFDDFNADKTQTQEFIRNSYAKKTVAAPLYQQVFEWLIKKGVVVRIDSKGVGYEVRAVEWEDFVWVDNKDSAIEKACELF